MSYQNHFPVGQCVVSVARYSRVFVFDVKQRIISSIGKFIFAIQSLFVLIVDPVCARNTLAGLLVYTRTHYDFRPSPPVER